ncbi:hypothetical protein L9F63_019703, partial [Diploptera punctata]
NNENKTSPINRRFSSIRSSISIANACLVDCHLAYLQSPETGMYSIRKQLSKKCSSQRGVLKYQNHHFKHLWNFTNVKFPDPAKIPVNTEISYCSALRSVYQQTANFLTQVYGTGIHIQFQTSTCAVLEIRYKQAVDKSVFDAVKLQFSFGWNST